MRGYIRLKELLDIRGVFAEYAELLPSAFQEIFGVATNDDIETLDLIFGDYYNNRILLSNYCDLFIEDGAAGCLGRVCKVANKKFKESWIAAKAAIEAAISQSVGTMGSETKTKTEQKNSAESKSEQNATNAYDDTTNPTDTNSSNGNGEYEHTIQKVETTTKNAAAQSAIEKLDFMRLNDWLAIVMEDIADVFSCSVY